MPVLVIFPDPDQLLRKYPHATYPSRFREIASRYHIHTIDLTPVFARHFDGFSSLFIEWDGHPNARTYRIAAGHIKWYLVSQHLVAPGSLSRKELDLRKMKASLVRGQEC